MGLNQKVELSSVKYALGENIQLPITLTEKMEKNIYFPSLRRIVFLITDSFLLYISFKLAILFFGTPPLAKSSFSLVYLIFTLIWAIVSKCVVHRNDLLEWIVYLRQLITSLFYVLVGHAFLFFLCTITIDLPSFHYSYFTGLYLIVFGLILGNRVLFFYAGKYYKRVARSTNRFVVVGAGSIVELYYQFFVRKHQAGEDFLGFFDDNPGSSSYPSLVVGAVSELKEYCLREKVNEIYFALPIASSKDLLEEISRFADEKTIFFRVIPDLKSIANREFYFNYIDDIPVITIRKEPLGVFFNRIIKRSFDIVFSLLVILTVFPWIFPIIMLAIKLTSKGPIFFKQRRAGIRKEPFFCYKFRTMYVNDQTHIQATKGDPRITKVGRFLRKTSLDELPQFFNALLGDMSVVGPRPYIFNQVEEYSKAIEIYKLRHFVAPGITGYAQINGLRGEVSHLQVMEKRVKYDIQYVENWSLFLDIKIIFLTVYNIFRGEENAY